MNKLAHEVGNYLAIVHDLASRSETWISRPAWVEFSTNNVCNLRCVMCGQSDGEPFQTMKKPRATVLLDELLSGASLITPHANSEPLLASIDLVLEKCREHQAWMNLITNATLMDGRRFRELADRIWKLSISIDSHVKEVFEKVRAQGDFELFERNVREIVPAAGECGVPVAFNWVLMGPNADSLAGFVDWVADLGGTEARAQIHVQQMLYNAKGCEDMRLEAMWNQEEVQGFLDAACERAEARGILLDLDLPAPHRRSIVPVEPAMRGVMPDLLAREIDVIRDRYPGFCSMAAYYLKVNPDGRCYPCCIAPDDLEMGNVHEAPIEEIWNGERFRSFRRRMFEGDYPESCRNCEHLIDKPAFPGLEAG